MLIDVVVIIDKLLDLLMECRKRPDCASTRIQVTTHRATLLKLLSIAVQVVEQPLVECAEQALLRASISRRRFAPFDLINLVGREQGFPGSALKLGSTIMHQMPHCTAMPAKERPERHQRIDQTCRIERQEVGQNHA